MLCSFAQQLSKYLSKLASLGFREEVLTELNPALTYFFPKSHPKSSFLFVAENKRDNKFNSEHWCSFWSLEASPQRQNMLVELHLEAPQYNITRLRLYLLTVIVVTMAIYFSYFNVINRIYWSIAFLSLLLSNQVDALNVVLTMVFLKKLRRQQADSLCSCKPFLCFFCQVKANNLFFIYFIVFQNITRQEFYLYLCSDIIPNTNTYVGLLVGDTYAVLHRRIKDFNLSNINYTVCADSILPHPHATQHKGSK